VEAQITIQIPQTVYRKAERLAHRRHQPLTDVLNEAIDLAEAAFTQQTHEEQQMDREEAAYEAMRNVLVASHLNEFVAIYQGKLIDSDPSEQALLIRLDQAYPNEVILMRQVTLEPESDLYFRSPRFI